MKEYPVVNPKLIWRMLDGEAVIVSPTTGEVRVLNQVGTDIWQQLISGSSIADIEDSLVQQYTLSSQQAKTDLSTFLNDLTKRGLITWESHVA